MKIWLARTRSIVPWSVLEKILPRHLTWEAYLADAGRLILAGPVPRPDGSLDGDGAAVYYAKSERDARRLAETDPFVVENARSLVSIEHWDVRCIGRRAHDLARGDLTRSEGGTRS